MGSDLNSTMEFYINSVAILVVASLGLLGNTLSILLFSFRKLQMNPTFTGLLVWLAVIDSLFLGCVVAVFCLPSLSPTYRAWVFPHLLPSLLPVTSIVLTASVYSVVALALERLLHLTRPQWSNRGAFFGYILPVLVFSTCYNFPKFFEFSTQLSSRPDGMPVAQATDFRKNADYSLYVLGINCVVMGLLPFSLLIGLNLVISRNISKTFNNVEAREGAMRALLTSIVLVQLVCHAPRTGLNIFEICMALRGEAVELSQTWVVDVSHLLLVTSSSCNVLIYVVQDLRFRDFLLTDLRRVLLVYRGQDRPVPAPEPLLGIPSDSENSVK